MTGTAIPRSGPHCSDYIVAEGAIVSKNHAFTHVEILFSHGGKLCTRWKLTAVL